MSDLRGGGLRALVRGYDRELVCGQCRSVMAWIRLGLWRLMRIRDVHGVEVTPLGGEVAVRVVRTRLADAEAASADPNFDLDVHALHRDLDYLRAAAGEVMYELECPTCRARYWRSLPALAAAVRAAPAGRVTLT